MSNFDWICEIMSASARGDMKWLEELAKTLSADSCPEDFWFETHAVLLEAIKVCEGGLFLSLKGNM